MLERKQRIDFAQVDWKKLRHKIEDWGRKEATEQQLHEIADRYGIGIPFLPGGQKHCPCCEQGKPCFTDPAQVRCTHQLRAGRTYYRVIGDLRERFVVTKAPYRVLFSENDVGYGPWQMDIRDPSGWAPSLTLVDYGVVKGPYGWSDSAYLAFEEGDFCPDCHHHCHQCHLGG